MAQRNRLPDLKKNYYSGRDVQRILGITEPKLRTLVSNKTLTKHYPPGRKTAVYLKSEVDAYAQRWEAFLLAKEPPKTTFSQASINDMQSEYDLAKRALGATMSLELRTVWLQKNSECDYVVKYGERVVAYLTILPLKHETLIKFMNGEIRAWDITSEDIELFESNKPLECFIAAIASDPDVGEETRSHYMFVLIRGLMQKFKELGERGVIISKIYATSETPTGIAMALHIGMEEIKPRIGKRMRFYLDVEKASSFLFQSYKEGLASWQEAQKVTPN